MLIISRKKEQKIVVADDIEIIILEIGRNRVRFGIKAPKQSDFAWSRADRKQIDLGGYSTNRATSAAGDPIGRVTMGEKRVLSRFQQLAALLVERRNVPRHALIELAWQDDEPMELRSRSNEFDRQGHEASSRAATRRREAADSTWAAV